MLTNADRLDIIESGLNAASLKMNNSIEFYETRDAINDIMNDIREMSRQLDYIDKILETSREIIYIAEGNYV